MLKAVTFDFWNTLFVDVHGREREALRADVLRDELERARAQASAARRSTRPCAPASTSSTASGSHEHRTPLCGELVDASSRSLGARLPAELFDARSSSRFERLVLDLPPEPMPGAVYTLPQLAERYRLAVICDTGYSPGSVLRELLERHGMLAYFEYLYFSNEHGMSKPDVRVFQHTLEELDVRAPEAAHVGDIQRTDIAGAQAAGMAAVHFIGANNHDAGRLHGRSHGQALRRAARGARRPHLCRLLSRSTAASAGSAGCFLIAASSPALAVFVVARRPRARRRAGRARRQGRRLRSRRTIAGNRSPASRRRSTGSAPGGSLAITVAALLGAPLVVAAAMLQAVYLRRQRSTVALVLNLLLKLVFERPRPAGDAAASTRRGYAFPADTR